MKRKINCEIARAFPIEKALAKLGHFPKKTTEKEAWFLSPFRSETQASFKVSKIKNRWYDHGNGLGGNVIDLVSKVLNCSVKEALDFFQAEHCSFSFQQQIIFNEKEAAIHVLKTHAIMHPALVQYLISRAISFAIAKKYCKEIWYDYKGGHFFGLGLKNHLGGWELRNKFFKNSSSPKSFTYLKQNANQLILLEGMFDLLSLATLDKALLKISDVIVLNSLTFIKDIECYLNNYEQVLLYLDNDTAGRNASNHLMKQYNGIIDKSSTYKNHKDVNEFICYEKRKISRNKIAPGA